MLTNELVFYAGRLIMDYPTFACETLMRMMARRTLVRHPFVSQRWHKKPHRSAAHRGGAPPLVNRYGAWMNESVFYVGRLIMTNPTVARETLMMVMARRTPVRHSFVSQDGIKSRTGVRRTGGQGLWLIVTGRG